MIHQSQIPHSNSANPIDILIVDDVPDNIRLLSRILVKRGYQTRKALNGNIALTAIQASKPSLILLDVQMPDMSGYELCHRVKSDPDTLHIPIIFVSANDDSSERRKAIHVGGADYISKPLNIEKLVASIKKQLELASIY
ncbi:response regulator [Oscillatoria acuminata]|uniref:Response regulator containing a CheY-like receiver domain and a GGDEF domain n=1 Tax=Oscillatoria acuminata PCC 6304 TaxID=56110 RepID=K9TNW1_9CYAN|nr:response regulator [Oscillatoria acuminata]AFY83704.1 response regulator containing a CheY-like receiver domain and a GGDEF domain [Oscillatoria acuminata PCC 6304]